uniref:Uncharacterized protein n=1 Tax=Rhizophora mucronata TaxID=61149 RepID=A0A2P2J1M7_RHIMU
MPRRISRVEIWLKNKKQEREKGIFPTARQRLG